MTRTQEYYDLKSADFKRYMLGVPAADLPQIRTIIRVALKIKNDRNIDLWWKDGAVTRNYLSKNISPEEQEIRISLIESLLEERPINSPQKTSEKTMTPEMAGKKLREYLTEDYIQPNLRKIELKKNGFTASYNAYGEEEEDQYEDEDGLEFPPPQEQAA